LFSSCLGDVSVEIPENMLSKEKMAKVMVDIHLLEASMNLNAFHPQKQVEVNNVIPFQEDVLKKHNITKKQYDESFYFYSRNPKLLGEVYDMVLSDLSQMQAEVNNGK
jgi:hypothetical protein